MGNFFTHLTYFEQILTVTGIIMVGLGGMAGGIGFLIQSFKKGKNLKTISDFDLFNKQIDGLQKICDSQEKEINELKDDNKKRIGEIGRLQGINEEKDKKVKELSDIIGGRDPETSRFFQLNLDALDKIVKRLDTIDDKIGIKK